MSPYTIREMCERYRDNRGCCWIDAKFPELSGFEDKGEAACLARTHCIMGMPSKNTYLGMKPSRYDDPVEMVLSVVRWIEKSVDAGRMWCPLDSVKCTKMGEVWVCDMNPLEDGVAHTLTLVQSMGFNPLTVSSVHAALECDRSTPFMGVYPQPSTSTPSTSLIGTAHTNSLVDMSPFEKAKDPDIAARTYAMEYTGYLCCAHSPHSYDAGRGKRVTMDVKVRLMSSYTIDALIMMLDAMVQATDEKADWTLFVCGQFSMVTESAIKHMCIKHRVLSMATDPGLGMYVNVENKVCVICIASGVLTKRCSNYVWADNCNTYMSDHTKFTVKPRIDTSGPDSIRACFSAHYNYLPYQEFNEAVRLTISSAQLPQAVCFPYCPATASVTPVHLFKPLVTTREYKRIMIRQDEVFDPASYMPGENVCVLYHNLDMNYEDATLVSKRYVENGGFSTTSVCRYLLPQSDYVPPPGSILCSRLSPWWKSRCQSHCRHTKEYVESFAKGSTKRTIDPCGPPTGTVIKKNILKTSGEQSVKVRSYESYQEGNKLSTGHGQKGVDSHLVEPQDLPMCVASDGTEIIPDVIVATSSIVTRQTLGQIYESVRGMQRLADPDIPDVVEIDEPVDISEDVLVLSPKTGLPYETAVEFNEETTLVETRGTVGFVRMFNQTQMTREKHFTSHRSMTKNTLRTPVRRSRGGAPRLGEMEVQALVAAGLAKCTEELRKRGDEVVVFLCAKCQRLRLLHLCTESTEFIEITIPYDLLVLDCMSKILHNAAFVYEVELDT